MLQRHPALAPQSLPLEGVGLAPFSIVKDRFWNHHREERMDTRVAVGRRRLEVAACDSYCMRLGRSNHMSRHSSDSSVEEGEDVERQGTGRLVRN